MSELKPVAVVTSGYIRQSYGTAEKFVHLDDYQRLRDEKAELPEGYRVEQTKLGLELWHSSSSHCLAMFSDGVFCFNPVYPKDAAAVIAFIQGAR